MDDKNVIPPGAADAHNRARMKILVIEDDPKTGDYLRKGLRESGYAVDLARTGTDSRLPETGNSYRRVNFSEIC